MPEIIVKLIKPEDEALLDEAYGLYFESIERTEQRPEDEFRALVARPDYQLIGAILEGHTAGLALSWVPPEAPIWLFEYAAISPTLRGHGIGANLFLASRHMAGAERTALVEVDRPDDETKRRRLSFYRRLDCRRIAGLDYLLPLDAFGTPPPMWLLAATSTPDQPSLSVHVVENWLRGIYAGAYGKPLDDPRLAQMIDPLPDDVELVGI